MRSPEAACRESCETTPFSGDSSLFSFAGSLKVLKRPGVESESNDSDDSLPPFAEAPAPGDFMGAGCPDTSDLHESVAAQSDSTPEARGKGAISDNVPDNVPQGKRICMHGHCPAMVR